MCCRLQLDLRELLKRGNGLFGSAEQTGSIGVVTINAARLGHLFGGDADGLLERLYTLMALGSDSLEIKRRIIQEHIDRGLYPYTKRYLGTLRNHFSTLGINGLNECIRNFTRRALARFRLPYITITPTFSICPKHGYLAGLHTAGIYPRRFAALLPLLDWVGFDVKAPFDERYDALTQVQGSADCAMESLRRLVRSGVEYQIRTTLDPAHLDETAREDVVRQLRAMGVRSIQWQTCRKPKL